MTEPIEYKELEREFFNMFNFIEEQAGVNEREHLKSFIQANFIPKSEIKEAIESVEIDKAHTYASENAEIYRAYENGQEAMKEKIVESLKSTLKLE